MSQDFSLQHLRYHVFPGSMEIAGSDRARYDDLFRYWKRVWTDTLKELDGVEKLYSDDFVRAGERTGVTYKGEIIAYFAFSWYDLRLASDVEHTYFKAYPLESLREMQKQGLNKVMSMGWLSVDRKWRKTQAGANLTEALIFQGYKRFLETDTDALIAFTRNDRKINERCYAYGSRCLRSGIREHNVDVDLVYTTKKDVREPTDPITKELSERLWQERIVYTSSPRVLRVAA